jgi:hypothetical protein
MKKASEGWNMKTSDAIDLSTHDDTAIECPTMYAWTGLRHLWGARVYVR